MSIDFYDIISSFRQSWDDSQKLKEQDWSRRQARDKANREKEDYKFKQEMRKYQREHGYRTPKEQHQKEYQDEQNRIRSELAGTKSVVGKARAGKLKAETGIVPSKGKKLEAEAVAARQKGRASLMGATARQRAAATGEKNAATRLKEVNAKIIKINRVLDREDEDSEFRNDLMEMKRQVEEQRVELMKAMRDPSVRLEKARGDKTAAAAAGLTVRTEAEREMAPIARAEKIIGMGKTIADTGVSAQRGQLLGEQAETEQAMREPKRQDMMANTLETLLGIERQRKLLPVELKAKQALINLQNANAKAAPQRLKLEERRVMAQEKRAKAYSDGLAATAKAKGTKAAKVFALGLPAKEFKLYMDLTGVPQENQEKYAALGNDALFLRNAEEVLGEMRAGQSEYYLNQVVPTLSSLGTKFPRFEKHLRATGDWVSVRAWRIRENALDEAARQRPKPKAEPEPKKLGPAKPAKKGAATPQRFRSMLEARASKYGVTVEQFSKQLKKSRPHLAGDIDAAMGW